jgi:hypothetical protein
MNEAQIESFRALASAMSPDPHDWEWIGKHLSQRMFGITEARAREYAERYGGEARSILKGKNRYVVEYQSEDCRWHRIAGFETYGEARGKVLGMERCKGVRVAVETLESAYVPR